MDDILICSYDRLRQLLIDIESLSKNIDIKEENGIKIDTVLDNQTRIFQIEKELRDFQYYIDNFSKVTESFQIIRDAYFQLVVSKISSPPENKEDYPKSPGVSVIQSEDEDNKIGDFKPTDTSKIIKQHDVTSTIDEECEVYHE